MTNLKIETLNLLSGTYQIFGQSFLFHPNELTKDFSFYASPSFQKSFSDICNIPDEEYSNVIEDTSGNHILLWESVYRGNKGTLLDPSTLKIQKIYEQFYLAVNPSYHQICDHISFELLFCSHLFSLLDAIEKEHTLSHLFFIKDFLTKHVLFLIEHSLPHLYGYYKKWVEFLQNEITQHVQFIDLYLLNHTSTKEEFDLTFPEITKRSSSLPAPYGFIKIEPFLSKERLFKTSGRNNCGGRCVIHVHENSGNILNLNPVEDELTCTKACVRGYGYRQTNLSPERLRYPMKRIGERGEGRFMRISWEEAIDMIANETTRITRTYGPESRYVNYSTGVSAMIRPDQLIKRMLSFDGGFLANYNSYSSACTDIATPYTYGTGFTGSSSHYFQYSKLIILWGHNPSESIFGSELLKELLNAKKKGCRIISIDPRYTDTAAALADEWIGIKPSTDSALTDAMAYVILTKGLEDRAFMNKYCIGFDEAHMPEGIPSNESYESYLFGKKDGIIKTPKWAEEITGIPSETIISLAIDYATSKPAALVQGLGPQRTCNGEQTARSSTLLPCLTGNVGIPGGYAGGNGFIENPPMPMIAPVPNPYPGVIPSFLWTDAITRGTEMTKEKDMLRGVDRLKAPIKLIFNLAGNTLLNQHSDVNKTTALLKDTSLCEFIVVSDLFMTPSAKFADILLPGTSFLESENITYPWREGNYFLYNPKIINPLFESRFEFDWIKELAKKLGVYNEFIDGKDTLEEWIKSAYEACRQKEATLLPFDIFRDNGGHFYKKSADFIAFREQCEDFENHPFPTPSGKIEIFSKRLYDFENPEEIPAIPRYTKGFEGPLDPLIQTYPLQLIGWHTKRRCHSIHDNNPWMEAIEPQRVWINPEDAKIRGISEEQLTEIWNDRGIVHLKAHITRRIISGVIAIPQGAWYQSNKVGVDIRGNINTLTTHRPTPLAKGNPQHTNLVDIRPVID